MTDKELYNELREKHCASCKQFKDNLCVKARTRKCIENYFRAPIEYTYNAVAARHKIEFNSNIKPAHYSSGKYDVIWFCEYHKLDFVVGNIIKYVFRSGKKSINTDIEDMEKAIEYCNRRIEYLKEKKKEEPVVL